MNHNMAKMVPSGKTEGRKGIVFSRQQELLHRTITVNPVIQSFADGFCYLSD
jgi:hypothetical protein